MNGTSTRVRHASGHLEPGGTTMGATAFLPDHNYQRPLRARAWLLWSTRPQGTPSRDRGAIGARKRHERGTKRVRRGYHLGTVFPDEKVATIVFASTCAAEKSLFPRRTAHLPNEPTHPLSPSLVPFPHGITKRTQLPTSLQPMTPT